MVTLKEYEAYLRVKKIIDSCDEAEIISKQSNERNYTPTIIELEGISPTKCYSSSLIIIWGKMGYFKVLEGNQRRDQRLSFIMSPE